MQWGTRRAGQAWVLGNRGCLSILLGNGDGTFQPPQTPYPCPEIYFDPLITGDFNGDGKLDLASAFPDLPVLQTFALFLPGNGDGTFSPSQSGSINGIYGSDVVAGDFNRDGRLDVAVPGDVIGNTSGGVAIFLQIPKGLVISPSSLTFANQLVGTTSAAQSVTRWMNSGSAEFLRTAILQNRRRKTRENIGFNNRSGTT
jgi:hypothetical protein